MRRQNKHHRWPERGCTRLPRARALIVSRRRVAYTRQQHSKGGKRPMTITPNRLREASLFKELSEDALIELAKHCTLIELAADEMLFDQDDPGDAVYMIEDGQIHIVRTYANGEEVVLATHGPYYTAGEISGLVGQPRTGAVVAVSDCTLIKLERDALYTALKSVSGAALDVLHRLGLRFYHMNLMVREHAIGNVVARVASLLMLLSGNQEGPVQAIARINRMARACGLDADMLDRVLLDMTNQGFIEYDGRHLNIKNIEAIRDFAG